MSTLPVTAVIVGAGHRSLTYASYALERPDRLRIVGVADMIERRRREVADRFGLSPAQCFRSAEELASRPRMADCAINGTMDHQHVPTTLPLLAAGYHVLLEKPFATSEPELWDLVSAARRFDRKVAICHILRYSPFYARIREEVLRGSIGRIISLQSAEHVSYHHMAVAFVRGKWNSTARSHSTMLMSKCCHDLDILAWMKSPVAPCRVASLGSNLQFRADRAPPGAGTRCLVDCPIESECLYSARKHYLDHPDRWSFYVWDALEHLEKPTAEDRAALLSGSSPYGRCVWRSDNDVVDHQSVIVDFADGATATHVMVGGASRPSRSIHLVGARGEIQGVLEEGRIVIRHIDPRPGHEYSEDLVAIGEGPDAGGVVDAHAGGDLRLVHDFVSSIAGGERSISSTRLEDSVYGHLIGFRADRARTEGRVLEIPTIEAGRRTHERG